MFLTIERQCPLNREAFLGGERGDCILISHRWGLHAPSSSRCKSFFTPEADKDFPLRVPLSALARPC
jgi:hypothetical protein